MEAEGAVGFADLRDITVHVQLTHFHQRPPRPSPISHVANLSVQRPGLRQVSGSKAVGGKPRLMGGSSRHARRCCLRRELGSWSLESSSRPSGLELRRKRCEELAFCHNSQELLSVLSHTPHDSEHTADLETETCHSHHTGMSCEHLALDVFCLTERHARKHTSRSERHFLQRQPKVERSLQRISLEEVEQKALQVLRLWQHQMTGMIGGLARASVSTLRSATALSSHYGATPRMSWHCRVHRAPGGLWPPAGTLSEPRPGHLRAI